MKTHPKTMMIKFEDLLKDPFGMSGKLLKFCECYPSELEYLRLKSKKTISETGNHNTPFGKLGKKYWFDKTTIQDMIVPDINTTQIERLDAESIITINKNAGEALEYFGYEIIC